MGNSDAFRNRIKRKNELLLMMKNKKPKFRHIVKCTCGKETIVHQITISGHFEPEDKNWIFIPMEGWYCGSNSPKLHKPLAYMEELDG